MGKQSPIIIAVTNKKLRDKIAEENRRIGGWNEEFDPFYGAPAILIVLADKSMPTYKYDGSLVMGNLMNAAESLGVNSIWIHRAKEEFESDFGKKILKDLGIEGDYEGIGHCAIGYAAEPLPQAAIKGLLWEGDGFLLLYKRLYSGAFQWPRSADEAKERKNDYVYYVK